MLNKEELWKMISNSDMECIAYRPLIFRGMNTNYSIDTFGNIVNIVTNHFKSNYIANNGYLMTSLNVDGKDYNVSVHILVAQTFIPNPNKYPVVNHKDGDKTNPYVTNLEWTTHKENTAHAIKMGLFNPKIKENKVRGINSSNNIHSENTIHKVCEMLEQGYGPTYISRVIPDIDIKSIDSIKRKRNWTHISKLYNIPDPKHRIPLDDITVTAARNYACSGLGTREIIRILSLPDDKYTYEQIAWIRRKAKKRS